MQAVSELKIIVPGICGPLAELDSLKNNEAVSTWINTLSKTRCRTSKNSFNDVIRALFNIAEDVDLPSAILTLIANEKFDPSLYYMHADPVFLRADMDHAVLTSSTDLDIQEEDASLLCNALNDHFEQEGLIFFKLNKDQWFVSSKNKIKLQTTSLVDATGRNINFILPSGEDSSHWKSILTEAQMLMHLHAVNEKRESSGLLTINSLWFHGSGDVESVGANSMAAKRIDSICSNHDMMSGLAKQFKSDHLKIPDSVNDYLDYLLSCKQGAVNIFHLSELEHLTNYTDTGLWAQQLEKTLDTWIYPILKMANKNKIKVTLYSCNKNEYQFSTYDYLKLWRKSKLEEHVSSY